MDSVLERKILNKKPNARVKTEKIVKTATALNNDLIISPRTSFLICLLVNYSKLDKLQ